MENKHVIKDFEMNGKRVEVYVSYNRGDWGGKRGYSLHVQPYESDGVFRTVVGFSGVKHFLLEVARKSSKKLQEAISMVNDEMVEQMLLQCRFD